MTEKHYTDYKGREFPGTFTVPDKGNVMKLTYGERELLLDIVGEHLSQVKSSSIVYGNKEQQAEVIDTLKSILNKVSKA